MPARDIFHDAVKSALQKDGWAITHDPLTVDLADGQMQVDLGAERLIAASKDKRQIAIEIKSFLAPSAISRISYGAGPVSKLQGCIKAERARAYPLLRRIYRDLRKLFRSSASSAQSQGISD